MTTVHDFSATDIKGATVPLSNYKGQVLLIVNTASECGLTPQYRGLEALYRTLHPKDFTVLGFPCNQFGAQEPGTESEIAQFCEREFHVTFPMFAKVDVNGEHAHPLWAYLKNEKGGEPIAWNFAKFLVDQNGKVVQRYAPKTPPEDIEADIAALL